MCTIRLQGELTISYASQQRETWLGQWPSEDPRCELDLSDIEACDSSGIQLLVGAHKLAQQRGGTLHLSKSSTAVLDALKTYGLTEGLVPATSGSST